MSHVAFTVSSIVDKLPVKIEALAIWDLAPDIKDSKDKEVRVGIRLVIGTLEGMLLVYEVKAKRNEEEGYQVTLLDTQRTFSKKPIQQLTVLEKQNLLICLSDGVLSAYEMPSADFRTSYRPLPSFKNAKGGCGLYAIDETRPNQPMLCASVRKKLLLYVWDGRDFVERKELVIPDVPKTVACCGPNLFVGFKKEYNMISITNGNISELFPTGKTGTPLATLLSDDQLLLARDNISIFIGFDGKPTRKYGLSWSDSPLLQGYCFPYVISLLKSFLEIRTIFGSEKLLQTISLKNAKLLTIKGSHIYVASSTHIWRLLPVPILNQVDQLLRDKEYEKALTLLENLNDDDRKLGKEEKIKAVKMQLAYYLYSQLQFDRAMELFFQLFCDPLEVIGLYHNMLPANLRGAFKYPPDVAVELTGAQLEKALAALVGYLTQVRPTLEPPTDPSEYMEGDYANVTNKAVIVDTTLLRATLKTNDTAVSSLLRIANYCHVKESVKLLTGYHKYRELVLLYKSKGLHAEALDLLSTLGQSRDTVSDPSMLGPDETILYLRELGNEHLELLLGYSKWVLGTRRDDALSIFTARRAVPLDGPRVLGHLKQYAPQLVIPFLEHRLHVEGDPAPELHNELVRNYLATITALRAELPPSGPVPPRAAADVGLLGETRRKLLHFLDQSAGYRAEDLISAFPVNDLYEERALMMARLGRHEEALEIYAVKLKDSALAEAYCAKHYHPDKEDFKDVYLTLFSVYMNPRDGGRPQTGPAMALLNKYYKQIDTPRAIELLPPETQIKQLTPFFEAVLREYAKTKRNNQVVTALLKAENLQVREQLMRARAGVIKIDESSTCPVCNKRLGTSVFACYPNGVVVHFICCTDRNVCPVTGTRFNK